ncbi:MAG: hypothetical protein QM790_10040 [Nibricoccus sp.]
MSGVEDDVVTGPADDRTTRGYECDVIKILILGSSNLRLQIGGCTIHAIMAVRFAPFDADNTMLTL